MRNIKLYCLACFTIVTMGSISAQDNPKDLPFRSIPDYPSDYTAATAVVRMIDALGFRYYWATEGLRKEDLQYRPSNEARSTQQTLDHILSLSFTISKVITETEMGYPEASENDIEQKREITLGLLKQASDHLRENPDKDFDEIKLRSGTLEFPFWHLINGQIADALTHVGQVVSFRRSTGNPINPKVSVFVGKISGE